MKIPFSKFLLRLILFSLFIGTFPVISLGLFSYHQSSSAIQEKVKIGNMQILQQTQMRVEQLLNTIDLSATQFINIPLVNSSLNLPLLQDHFAEFRELIEGMHRLQSFELGIRDVILLNSQKGWVISNQLILPSDQANIQGELELASIHKTSFWFRKGDTFDQQATVNTDSNKTIKITGINLVKKLPINTLNPLAMIIVNIPFTELNKLLVSNGALGELMVLDEEGIILAHSDERTIGQNMKEMVNLDQVFSPGTQDQGYFLTDMGRREIGVSFRKSAVNGWIYLSVVSVKDISKDSRSIGFLTLFICIAIWVLTFIVSLKGSRRMYSPINTLYQAALSTRTETDEDEREKDEIQFIGSRMQFLQQIHSQMSNQLYGQTSQLRDYFVLKLLLNGASAREIEEKIELIKFPRSWNKIAVFSIQIDTLDGTRYEQDHLDLLMYAIGNMIGELLPPGSKLNPVTFQQSLVVIVGGTYSSNELFKQELYSRTMNIQESVYYFLQLKVSIGISRIYKLFTEMPLAFQESLEALRYRIRFGQQSVSFIDNVLHGPPAQFIFPDQIENRLLEAIKMFDVELVNDLLHEFLNNVLTANVSFRESQISLVRLLIDLMRILQENGESLQPLIDQEKSVFDHLFQLKTEQEINEWFRNKIIAPIIDALEKHREIHHKKISEQLYEMIRDQFDTDLTLEVCASKLNYHPNYLRQVFRKETGLNFSEYLSGYRLKMAKKWLIETDMKISEIAEKLKYNNSQNFIRYFRKEEGVTPGQYRDIVKDYKNI